MLFVKTEICIEFKKMHLKFSMGWLIPYTEGAVKTEQQQEGNGYLYITYEFNKIVKF